MAFKKLTQTPFGIDVQNAYHRVEGLQFITKNLIKFKLRASVDGILPHFNEVEYECNYDIQGDNPIRQAYRYLKTLSDFANAIDC